MGIREIGKQEAVESVLTNLNLIWITLLHFELGAARLIREELILFKSEIIFSANPLLKILLSGHISAMFPYFPLFAILAVELSVYVYNTWKREKNG